MIFMDVVAHEQNTHLAGALSSTHVSCTQRVVSQLPTFPQPMIQQLEELLKVSLGLGSLTGATSFEKKIFFFSLTKAR